MPGLWAVARTLFSIYGVVRALEEPVDPNTLRRFPTIHVANISKMLPPGYDKTEFPEPKENRPIRCYLSFNVENIVIIDERRGYLKYQAYMRIYWRDRRVLLPEEARGYSSVTLNPSLADHLWLPDLIIHNMEDMEPVTLLRQYGYLVIFKHKYIKYMYYLRTSVTCNMEFSSYPFDTQECRVQFASYTHNASNMLWDWLGHEGDIFSTNELDRGNFVVSIERSGPLTHCHQYNNQEDCHSTLLLTTRLRRRTFFFLWDTFLPCVLLVTTSWLSMLLPPEVIPGRMVLCITSLLALLTMFTSSLTGVEVSYIRASDVWYVGCLTFEFLIILEYVVIIYIQREQNENVKVWAYHRKIHPSKANLSKSETTPKSDQSSKSGVSAEATSAFWRLVRNPAQMDRVSRWVVAILFFFFNVGFVAFFAI